MYYRTSSQTVSDLIDGEAVIINLETGNYYNLRDVGAAIWPRLVKGAGTEDLVSFVARKYAIDAERVGQEILAFLNDLEQEGLIHPQQEPGQVDDAEMQQPAEQGAVYQTPTLTVFSDMRDFLLVDPIHEVDEKGHPKHPRAPE